MEIKYYSKLPSKMHLYVVLTLALLVIGFTTLMQPFLIGDLETERYDLNQLEQVVQGLEEQHVTLWKNLDLSWKEFWRNKVDSRINQLYTFSDAMYNQLRSIDSKTSGDKAAYHIFYETFLKTNTLSSALPLDATIYYYLIDSNRQISPVDGSPKPSWTSLNDLHPIENLYYLDNGNSNFLRNATSSSNYLQYDVEVSSSPDSSNAILTFLFSDFAMENDQLRFAVSIDLGKLLDYSQYFFTQFNQRMLNLANSNDSPLKTTLISINKTEDGSFYFQAYGKHKELNHYYAARNKVMRSRKIILYEEVADSILSVINPTQSTAMLNSNLNFLFSTIDREERSKRLNLALQIKGYMQPFIVNNMFEILSKSTDKKHIPRIISVGKMRLLPVSQNLVLFDSIIDQAWWDREQFINNGYLSKLRNVIFLFVVFFVIVLIPLLCYTYFAKRYAKDFFAIQQYIDGLPNAEDLIAKHDGRKIEDIFPTQVQVEANNLGSKQILAELQQRFAKLGKAVDYWREQSATDELTGLLNRKGLNQICAYETSRMKRSGSSFSLILLDIDKFKNINDQYGHEVGDLALNSLAKLLVSTFRISDYLSRWGGEEFLIILPDTSLPGAIQVAESARKSVETMMIQSREASLRMTISIGVSCCSPECPSFTDMLNYADKSLYQAKQNGRNQVWAYSEEEGVHAISPTEYRKSSLPPQN